MELQRADVPPLREDDEPKRQQRGRVVQAGDADQRRQGLGSLRQQLRRRLAAREHRRRAAPGDCHHDVIL